MDSIKQFLKQLFCKHEYEWCRKVATPGKVLATFSGISGETHYLVCQKCGKVKDTMFVKYD